MLFVAFLLLGIQACLVQNVSSQCIRPYATGLTSAAELASPLSGDGALALISAPFAASVTIPFSEPFLVKAAADHFVAYGGAGIGEVTVMGEIPAVGTTLVKGEVPILGTVRYGGIVPAEGGVSISGSCACGCMGSYIY